MMTTRFVTIEVPLPDLTAPMQRPIAATLQEKIAQALAAYGTPLRWAITAIDRDRHVALLEAVVTHDRPTPG
jgi:hypothetical protein